MNTKDGGWSLSEQPREKFEILNSNLEIFEGSV